MISTKACSFSNAMRGLINLGYNMSDISDTQVVFFKNAKIGRITVYIHGVKHTDQLTGIGVSAGSVCYTPNVLIKDDEIIAKARYVIIGEHETHINHLPVEIAEIVTAIGGHVLCDCVL